MAETATVTVMLEAMLSKTLRGHAIAYTGKQMNKIVTARTQNRWRMAATAVLRTREVPLLIRIIGGIGDLRVRMGWA